MSRSKWYISVVTSISAFLLLIQPHGYLNNMYQGEESTEIGTNPFIIVTSILPKDQRFNPTIANGYLGHRIYNDTIHKNGLYNGKMGESHRARIPTTLPYMTSEGVTFTMKDGSVVELFLEKRYIQNMKHGTYTMVYHLMSEKSGKLLCDISQIFYAHRVLTRLLITEISVNFHANGTLFLPSKSHCGEPSQDINFKYENSVDIDSENTISACGHTFEPEADGYGVLPVCYIATKFSDHIAVDGITAEKFNFSFITSIAETLTEAQNFYKTGIEMQNNGVLLSSHINEWEQTWSVGSIILSSDNLIQSYSTVSSLYYLLSSFPSALSYSKYPYEFFGVSPGGLANGGKGEDYLGHVFWDQDFWILPALLPLFPDFVRLGLEYRVARLEQAKNKAKDLGFKGAMYPWESAYSGIDVCPGEKYVLHEQHVTGDLIHTMKQYIYLTGNWDFLSKKIPISPETDHKLVTPWDMLYETAVFWVSRAVWDDTRSGFVIHNVMGPDEYHSNVNNSVFTNVVASQNIIFAIEVAKKLNFSISDLVKWKEVAKNLVILYDKNLNYHPEYDGFDFRKDDVKQADVIMLGFPLMADDITKSSKENDLEIYAKITDPKGPAMTWSMFSINWDSLNHFFEADEYFLRQYLNIQKPFQIWSEESSGDGAVNFLTGIGGYLQSIMYGYLGLRVNWDHIIIRPRLPPGLGGKTVSELVILGVKYQGVILDFKIENESCVIKLAGYLNEKRLNVTLHTEGRDFILSEVGDYVTSPLLIKCRIMIDY